MERDRLYQVFFKNGMNFNSHAHVERDLLENLEGAKDWNFNSHAHVERDPVPYGYLVAAEKISTHTLTWSVTRGRL